MIRIFDVSQDKVIDSSVGAGVTTYDHALEVIYPLIDRFEHQRKLQRVKFYERLEADIVNGCIMPPITLAFVDVNAKKMASSEAMAEYVQKHISKGYVLDGMQRLNTLRRASGADGFDGRRPLYMNVIIAEKYDLLVYRMITLNNGQKPMTVRHQVEMLTATLLDEMLADKKFENLTFLSEKETEANSPRGSIRRADVVSAYTAFLTRNENNQNSRIIEDKLDEILVGRIMDNDGIEDGPAFSKILSEADRLASMQNVRAWLRNENNLVGFALGAIVSMEYIEALDADIFNEQVVKFEKAFEIINPSKVNVGRFRRELSRFYMENIQRFSDLPLEDVEESFLDKTAQ